MLPLCFYAGPQLHDQELVLVFKKRIFDLHKGSFRPTNLKRSRLCRFIAGVKRCQLERHCIRKSERAKKESYESQRKAVTF